MVTKGARTRIRSDLARGASKKTRPTQNIQRFKAR